MQKRSVRSRKGKNKMLCKFKECAVHTTYISVYHRTCPIPVQGEGNLLSHLLEFELDREEQSPLVKNCFPPSPNCLTVGILLDGPRPLTSQLSFRLQDESDPQGDGLVAWCPSSHWTQERLFPCLAGFDLFLTPPLSLAKLIPLYPSLSVLLELSTATSHFGGLEERIAKS